MKTSPTRQYIFCCLTTATLLYALTTKNWTLRLENQPLLSLLIQNKTDIKLEVTPLPGLHFKPTIRYFHQIPIATTSLLTQTATYITAVSYIEA